MIRERAVRLTDHPGATVEDFDSVRRPFNSVHAGPQRHHHKAYLDRRQHDDETTPLEAKRG